MNIPPVPPQAAKAPILLAAAQKPLPSTDSGAIQIDSALDLRQSQTLPVAKSPSPPVQLWAEDERPVASMEDVQAMLKEVISESFPELNQASLSLAPLHDDAVFFQSNFKPLSLLKRHKEYIIQVNPELFQRKLPREAAKAILAHELSHTLDFKSGGLPGVLGVGLKLLTHPECYEHRTDLQAISRGYGKGLIAYRQWIYTQIPAKDLAKKQATYYQPHEIQSLIRTLDQARLQGLETELVQAWLQHPPLTDPQIQQSFQDLLTHQKKQ